MIKNQSFIFVFFLGFSIFFNVQACLLDGLKEKKMQLVQVGKNTILNGSPIQIYELISPICSLQCYMLFLDKKDIKFSRQGSLFYIAENGGITIQILSVNKYGFSGRMICSSSVHHKLLMLPGYIKLGKPTTDFQSEDNGEVSRTMMFKNFKRTDYQVLINQIRTKSKMSDINNAFSYFDLGGGDEINLIFDVRKSISNLVVVNVRKSYLNAK